MITENYSFNDITYTIYIGKNALDNWKLIDLSAPNDIWIHINNHPSAHVVIVSNNLKIPINVIQYGAYLCKMNSKFNYLQKIKCVYTFIKNVKKGDEVGSVYTTNNKIIVA